MQASGVRPDSGRYAGIDRAVGLGTTIASVDAQNRARNEVRNTGLQLKGGAIGLGNRLAAQTAGELSGAVSTATQPISTQIASTGIVQPGYTAAQAGYGAQAKTLDSLYKTSVDTWDSQNKLNAANAQGMGNFIGTGLGLMMAPISPTSAIGAGMKMLSSKKAKQNREPVAEGESLKAVEAMPVETYDYKPGQGDGGSHVGPMAEDFAAATGQGDGKTIAVQDAIGITMGAVKDLAGRLEGIKKVIGIGSDAGPARSFPWVDGDPHENAAHRTRKSVGGGRRMIGLGDRMQPAAAIAAY
jgi:hypothetical protein